MRLTSIAALHESPCGTKQTFALQCPLLQCSGHRDAGKMSASEFEFVFNLRTAKALGITVPPTLRARADGVVE